MDAPAASARPLGDTPREAAPALVRARARWLALALAGAFCVRLALVWQRATPNYFPDEYLYAALGRSLGALGGPTVRGHAAHFPALLQPLLTSAAWRVGGVETGYRLVQALNAAALTLAAVPAWLLARRVGLGRGVALAVAALALLVPDALYAGLVVAEPFAYPLVLAAALAAVGALARPGRRAQLAFLALAAAAALARVQFAALPLCYLLAAAIVAARERAPRRVAREQRLVLAVLGAAAAALLAAGAQRVAGYYGSVLHPHVRLGAAAGSLGADAAVLLYASGWILAPGALLGLGLGLARPRSRTELAFSAFTASLAAALLLQAALFGDAAMVQERYVFYLAPLLVAAFGLYASRGWPLRLPHALLALSLLAVSARVPLSGWAQPGRDDHSPFLLAVQQAERVLGGSAAGAGLVAGLAGALALGAVAASLRPRRGTAVVLVLAAGFAGAAFLAAWRFDAENSRQVLRRYLPEQPSWVDAAGIGPVTLLTSPGGRAADAEEQLFWNRSIRRVAVLRYAAPPDRLAAAPATVTDRGLLLADGRPLRGAVAVDGYGTTVVLRGARAAGAAPHFRLWRPRGPARIAAMMPGRYWDGLLARSGAIFLWPGRSGRLAGRLELELRGPRHGPLSLALDGVAGRRLVRAAAGARVRVRLPVCSRGPWSVSFAAPTRDLVGGRPVSGWSSPPRYVPDPSACARAHARRP